MKGLDKIPSAQDLSKTYDFLQFTKTHASESELALWSQWTRFDPRLAEIFITYILKNWTRINPVQLNLQIKTQAWPSVFGVLMEQALMTISNADKTLFRHWKRCVMTSISPAPWELYFIGTRAFAGSEMRKDVEYSLNLYKRWGYFGRDYFLNHSKKLTSNSTHMDQKTRLKILKNLTLKKERITIHDYLIALNGGSTQRQAQRDLQKCQFLKKTGQTRARFYRLKKQI